jgi:hypothetical protein
MKNTKIIITALLGLFINVASAENYSAEIRYTSDYFYRGALKTSQAVQSSVGLSASGGGLGFSAGAFTNQAVDSGSDTYILSAGISKSFVDELLSAYAGVNHVEDVAGAAALEAQVSIGLNWPLSPSLSVYRDLDDSLYTYELALSHELDLEVLSLGLNGSIGNTETSSSADNSYYTVGAVASRSLSDNSTVSLGVTHVDSDTISNEYVFDFGVAIKF